jgi:hypothetical protein
MTSPTAATHEPGRRTCKVFSRNLVALSGILTVVYVEGIVSARVVVLDLIDVVAALIVTGRRDLKRPHRRRVRPRIVPAAINVL